jgi:hypothetical protein
MMDSTPSWIFCRCPECAREQRPGWCAILISKFPRERELSTDQETEIYQITSSYVERLWDLTPEERERMSFTPKYLPGEHKLTIAELGAIAEVRQFTYWVADIRSTDPNDGPCHCTIDIRRPEGAAATVH